MSKMKAQLFVGYNFVNGKVESFSLTSTAIQLVFKEFLIFFIFVFFCFFCVVGVKLNILIFSN